MEQSHSFNVAARYAVVLTEDTALAASVYLRRVNIFLQQMFTLN